MGVRRRNIEQALLGAQEYMPALQAPRVVDVACDLVLEVAMAVRTSLQ